MSRTAALRFCLAAALPVAVAPVVPAALAAQTSPALRDAKAAFDGFDFPHALALGRAALTANLNDTDRATAYEIVGFSLGALDSTDKALTALEQFIVLDPDRLPPAETLGPRLVDLYTQARALVLVVRRPRVDSAEFVAGRGEVHIHYEVSRPAVVTTTVIGPGVHAMIDSSLVNPGAAIVSWDPRLADSTPVPPGTYEIVVSAFESHDQYQALGRLAITHAPVDTLPHLTGISGLDTLPTMVRPPRDWRPLGLSVLLSGLAGGLALALDNSGIGGGHRELFAGGGLTIGVGLVLSLRRPDLRPVPANIHYNEQVQRLLDERNRQIAAQNAQRRREVLLRVTEVKP